jgi:hypothetical protein
MIACAASAQPSGDTVSSSACSTLRILPYSSTWPITPVEAISTCSRGQPSSAEMASMVRSTATAPALPVKLLARPVLTRSARTRPPETLIAALHQSTGAEPTLWRVNTPATADPSAKRIRVTSSRLCRYMPAQAAASTTPLTGAMAGNGTASGETARPGFPGTAGLVISFSS